MGTATVYPTAADRRLVAEGSGKKIPERLLAKLWKERAARQTGLRTEAGQRVRVVYPGRVGTAAGPDFRDALLEVEGQGLVRGDVELHIRQSDWDSHGHGGDPNYNGVVVHGALEVSSEETRLQSGRRAPVVDLRALLEEGPGGSHSLDTGQGDTGRVDLWQVLAGRGFPKPGSMEEAGKALDRAGDLRFQLKGLWLERCIQADGPDQALYRALMEGLGYGSNRRPFIELASRAAYGAVAQAALQLPPGERFDAICGWLAACSGLDGAESPGPPGPRRPKNIGPAMNLKEWRLFRVRPANHPRRRIVGAAIILDRFLEPGLAAGLSAVVRAADGNGDGGNGARGKEVRPAELTAALCASSLGGPAYVGPGRAKDLAVNAVLPFMHAWAEAGGPAHDGPGQDAVLAIYHRFPLLTGNEITREMTEQLLPVAWRGAVGNARRQQGLLHLSDLLRGSH